MERLTISETRGTLEGRWATWGRGFSVLPAAPGLPAGLQPVDILFWASRLWQTPRAGRGRLVTHRSTRCFFVDPEGLTAPRDQRQISEGLLVVNWRWKGSRATEQGYTQGCSLGRMRHKLQAKRANLCVSAQKWKKGSLWISSYHLLTVDEAMQGALGWRGWWFFF